MSEWTDDPEAQEWAKHVLDDLVPLQLTGEDGNAFAIMGTVQRARRRAGVADEEISRYREESMSGDYDNLLATAMRWADVS